MSRPMVAGIGTSPIVGSYDQVAQRLKYLSDAGLDGIALGLVNYIDEFPILQHEILPRLERLSLHNPYSPAYKQVDK
jgi:FMNH2-dependent dimethyl sulfone monooxygenase